MFGLPLDPILLVPFMLAGILVNVTPGADVGFVLASGLRGGKRRGMAAALGISLGSLLHTALAAMGVAALLHSHVWAYDALRYLGAVYLAVLAWRAWAGAGAPLSARGAKWMRRAVIQGFMTNILNPKVALFVLAFLPKFTNPAVGPVWQQMLLLGGLFTSTGLIVTIGYGVLAGTVSTHLQRHERRLEKISAVAFGGLAARMAWQ